MVGINLLLLNALICTSACIDGTAHKDNTRSAQSLLTIAHTLLVLTVHNVQS